VLSGLLYIMCYTLGCHPLGAALTSESADRAAGGAAARASKVARRHGAPMPVPGPGQWSMTR
jgi:hypothetical protein